MNFFELNLAGFLLAVILLGMISAQVESLRLSRQAYDRTFAFIQLQNMLERLRANHSFTSRRRELEEWNANNMRLLSGSNGNYQCVAQHCRVVFSWQSFGRHRIHQAAIIL